MKKIIIILCAVASCAAMAFIPKYAGHQALDPALSGLAEKEPVTVNVSEKIPDEKQVSAMAPDALGKELLTAFNNNLELLQTPVCTGEPLKIEGIVEKGDTISKILENASGSAAPHYVNATRKVFSLNAFRTGQPYAVVTDPNSGRLKRFEYEINATRRLVVEGEDTPRARLENIEFDTVLETANCVIEDNLFQAVADAGESPLLALRLVELFGSEINFLKDIKAGDSFAALVEKRYRDGEYKGYGRILAARFSCKGKSWHAYLYHDNAGNSQYYNEKGENLRKTFLQAPLAVTRLTSRYTHSRRHPILGFSRPHLGVDYGAPTGTPVKAVGSGVITKRGWAGGYGNQIIIKHDGGLESMYSHLSGFNRSLKQGASVRQGQIIGYVGSTGLSTGPHLDFRLRSNGKFINPTKAINPRGEPVPAQRQAHFKQIVQLEKAYLEGKNLPEKYSVDSLLPMNVKSVADRPKIGKSVHSVKKPGRRAYTGMQSKKRS